MAIPTVFIDIETVCPPGLPDFSKGAADFDHGKFGATSIFLAEIVCVGVHVLGEQPRAFVNRGVIPGEKVAIEGKNREAEIDVHRDEASILATLNAGLGGCYRFVGWNSRGFDLPLLINRMTRHDIQPCESLWRAASEPKFKPDRNFDLMDVCTFFARRTTLREAAIGLLGVDPKVNGDGSNVAKLVADGRIDDLVRYCLGDVEITRQIYERWLS